MALLLFAVPCLTALASRLEPPRPRRDALPLPELARVPLLRRVRSPRLPTYAEAQASAVQHLPGFLSEDDLAAIHRLAARVRQRQGTAGNWSHRENTGSMAPLAKRTRRGSQASERLALIPQPSTKTARLATRA